jgi:hypothetical protein
MNESGSLVDLALPALKVRWDRRIASPFWQRASQRLQIGYNYGSGDDREQFTILVRDGSQLRCSLVCTGFRAHGAHSQG